MQFVLEDGGRKILIFLFSLRKRFIRIKMNIAAWKILVYLQMVGSRNKEKERKINQLLEDDRKKVLELAIPDPDEELPFHLLYVLKKIKIWFSSRCRAIEIYNLW